MDTGVIMKDCKKVVKIEYLVAFLLVVVFLSLLNMYSLIEAYESGRVVNNQQGEKRIETDLGTYFWKRNMFLDANCRIRLALGQKYINGVWILNNEYITMDQGDTSAQTLDDYADQLCYLQDYLKDEGIAFLYVQAPATIAKGEDRLPYGLIDYSNSVADAFVERLHAREVDCIDLRDYEQLNNIDHYALMYRTDHHWRVESGLFAAQCLSDYLCERYGYEYDPRLYDPKRYERIMKKESFFGSVGLRLGSDALGKDDFGLLRPCFETDVSIDYSEGEWLNTVYNTEACSYDGALDVWEKEYYNNMPNNGKRIMITGNSFCKAVAPFMLLSCNSVKSHFMSKDYDAFDKEYIRKYSPDYVVVICSPMGLAEGGATFMFDAFR